MSRHFDRLEAVFEAIIDEARSNKDFAERLERAIAGAKEGAGRKANRRAKAVLNPFSLFEAGEQQLRVALAQLHLEQVKDIVAEYGMDRSRLALKWRSSGRLADLIVDTVRARVRKGEAFKSVSPTMVQRDVLAPEGSYEVNQGRLARKTEIGQAATADPDQDPK